MGRILFYLLWPLTWMYAPITRRVRLVILRGDEFVAVRNSFGPGLWQLPGGGIKVGETVQAAALREATEELGLDLQKVVELHDEFKVVRQFGLLMRYHFVCVKLDSKKQLKAGRGVYAAEWRSTTDTKARAREIEVGLELAA